MKNVIFKKENKAGHIILNRPEKINSLTYEMIQDIDNKLEEWEKDKGIFFILMYGMGSRGFCAGGDMKIYYDYKDQALEIGRKFFSLEYEMDLKIINYPKPIIAFLDGIVMGGGVGLAYGADYRLVTETTKWAMPEVNIGFFSDVGGSYFLNQIPKEMGRYVGLTGRVLSGDDVLYLGYAEEKIFKEDIEKIIEELSAIKEDNIEKEIKKIINKYKKTIQKSYLEKNKDKIKLYFTGDSMETIFSNLKEGMEKGDTWAKDIFLDMRKKSLLSQYIIFQQLERSQNLSIEECFEQELILALNFMDNPDFYEGLRSVLVDKNEANWKYKEAKDITEELVNSYFEKK